MTLPLTSETLAAAYEYLRTTPPFVSWGLPEPEEIIFKVSRRATEFGRYRWDGKRHTIECSCKSIGHTTTLMQFMAHEIVHLHLEETDTESRRGDEDTHNGAFRLLAAQVCKFHGFDPKAFY